MKLAIVGSVDLTEKQVHDVAWLIECVLIYCKPHTVISGGADGVDSIAINRAEAWGGTETQVFLPEVERWYGDGKKGYKLRNIEIAEACDELVAIRSLQSETYGSGWTADYAEKIGRKVRRFYV